MLKKKFVKSHADENSIGIFSEKTVAHSAHERASIYHGWLKKLIGEHISW